MVAGRAPDGHDRAVNDQRVTAWREFRSERVAELREPFGWLCLRGFHWLPDGDAEPGGGQLDGLPGTWWTDGAEAHVRATPDAGFHIAEAAAPAVDGFAAAPLDGESTRSVGPTERTPWIRWHSPDGVVDIELLNRGHRYAVRLRAADSPDRSALQQVPAWDYDPDWVVEGRFTAYAPEPPDGPRVVVDTIRPDLRQSLRALGEVEFTLAGEPQRLLVTTIKAGYGVEFFDPTNGVETEAWRQLKFDDPDPEGRVQLDFNHTLNMWFAFTRFATCPAPVPGNRITVPVRAGERRMS